jgi:hypothetical protein
VLRPVVRCGVLHHGTRLPRRVLLVGVVVVLLWLLLLLLLLRRRPAQGVHALVRVTGDGGGGGGGGGRGATGRCRRQRNGRLRRRRRVRGATRRDRHHRHGAVERRRPRWRRRRLVRHDRRVAGAALVLGIVWWPRRRLLLLLLLLLRNGTVARRLRAGARGVGGIAAARHRAWGTRVLPLGVRVLATTTRPHALPLRVPVGGLLGPLIGLLPMTLTHRSSLEPAHRLCGPSLR